MELVSNERYSGLRSYSEYKITDAKAETTTIAFAPSVVRERTPGGGLFSLFRGEDGQRISFWMSYEDAELLGLAILAKVKELREGG